MLHVHDRQLAFVFSCVEKGIEFCSDSRRVLGFNLLNARRGVKPTPCDVRARY